MERVGEHRDGAVDQGTVAQPVAAAGIEVVERHPGHVLVAAGQGQVHPAPAHLHRGRPHRLQARTAEPVDGVGGHRLRYPRGERDAAGVERVGPDLTDAAHHHLVDVGARHAGAVEAPLWPRCAELVGGHVLEGAAEAAHGRAGPSSRTIFSGTVMAYLLV